MPCLRSEHRRDGPETFAVPDLDQLPGMGDFFRMGGADGAGADANGEALPGLQDNLLPVPDDRLTSWTCVRI